MKANNKKKLSERKKELNSFPKSRVLDFSITESHLEPVSLYKLVQHVVAQCENDMASIVEQSQEIHEKDKNEVILKTLLISRERLMRLAALIRWSKTGTQGMLDRQEEIQELNDILMAYEETAWRLLSVNSGSQFSQKPIHDIPNAIDILNTGSYQRLPRKIEENMDSKMGINLMNKVMNDLTDKMRLKILQEKIPDSMEIVSIKHAKLKIRVSNEFEMILTLALDPENETYFWRILNLKILINRYNVCVNPLGRHSSARMIELLQTRIYKKYVAYPFMDIYQWVHNLCLRIAIDIIYQQTQKLTKQSNGALEYTRSFEKSTKELRIHLKYWKNFPKLDKGTIYYMNNDWAGELLLYIGNSTEKHVKDMKIDHRPILDVLPKMNPSKIDLSELLAKVKRQRLLSFWNSVRDELRTTLFQTVHVIEQIGGEVRLEVYLIEQYRLSMFIEPRSGRILFEIFQGHHLVTNIMNDNKYQFEFEPNNVYESYLGQYASGKLTSFKLINVIYEAKVKCLIHSLQQSASLLGIDNFKPKNSPNKKNILGLTFICSLKFPSFPDVVILFNINIEETSPSDPIRIIVSHQLPLENGTHRTTTLHDKFFINSLTRNAIPSYRDDDDYAPPFKKKRKDMEYFQTHYFDTTFEFVRFVITSQNDLIKRHLILEQANLYKMPLYEKEDQDNCFSFVYPFNDVTPLKIQEPTCELFVEGNGFHVIMDLPMGNLQLPYDFDDASMDTTKLVEQTLVIVQDKQENKFKIRFNMGPQDTFEDFVCLAKKVHYMSVIHSSLSEMKYRVQIAQQTPTFIHFKYGPSYAYSCLLTYDTYQKKYMLDFDPVTLCTTHAICALNSPKYKPIVVLERVLSSISTTLIAIQKVIEENDDYLMIYADNLLKYTFKFLKLPTYSDHKTIMTFKFKNGEMLVNLTVMDIQNRRNIEIESHQLEEKIVLKIIQKRWEMAKLLYKWLNDNKGNSFGQFTLQTKNLMNHLDQAFYNGMPQNMNFEQFRIQKFFHIDVSVQGHSSHLLNELFANFGTEKLSQLVYTQKYIIDLFASRHDELFSLISTNVNEAQCRITKIHTKVPLDVNYPSSFNEILRSPQVGAPLAHIKDKVFFYFVRLTSLQDDSSYVDLPIQCVNSKCILNAPYIDAPNLEADRIGEHVLKLESPIQTFIASCLRQSIPTLVSL